MNENPLEVLLIIDVQNDFCPGGSLGVERGHVVAGAINNHLERLEAINEPYDFVVTTQDWHIDPGAHFSEEPDFIDSWPVHCVAGTKGAELHPAIKDVESYIDEKFFKGQYTASYSGFEAKNESGVLLGDWLRQKGEELGREVAVTVVGIAYDYCVKATAMDAGRQGFSPQIIYTLTAPVHADGFYTVARSMVSEGVVVHAVES